MATRKKAGKAKKSTAKRTRKPVARKKVLAVRKTVAKKRPAPAKKKPAPKKKVSKPAPRIARRPSKPPRPAKPAAAPAPAPAPAPLVGEERVGVVTHYYGHISVATVLVEGGGLRVGDTIHVVGHTSDFRQRVDSMQLEHESILEALPDQEIGLRVTEHAREHDVVYKAAA